MKGDSLGLDGLVPTVSGHHRTACICPALTAGQVRFLPAEPTKEELFLPPDSDDNTV